MSILSCTETNCEKPAYYRRDMICKAHYTKRRRNIAAVADCLECGVQYQKLGRNRYCSTGCRVASIRRQNAADRIVPADDTKECSRCGEVKERGDFGKDKRRSDGLFPYCRDCRREYIGASRQQAAEMSKNEYNQKRWERIRQDPALREATALQNREAHLIRKYGMTLECYERMLAAQGACCRICGVAQSEEDATDRGGYRRAFAVDHDHSCCPGSISCGKCVRGLLCTRCNTGLGAFRDDPSVIAAAMAYLQLGMEVAA